MTTISDRGAPVRFEPLSRHRHIARVGILGAGDVTRNKIWKALARFQRHLDGIAVCSLERTCPLEGMPHLYYPLPPEGHLPLDALYDDGYLSRDTLWIVATPSEWHVPYALALAPHSRVAVEKPLAACLPEVEPLRPLVKNGAEIYPIDHKLFNKAALDFVETCRMDPALLERVHRIEATFFETAGFRIGRRQEDCIADIQWHQIVLTVAFFHAGGVPFDIVPQQVLVARHGPDPQGASQLPTFCTATRVRSRLLYQGREIACDFRQAKGAPHDDKSYRLYDRQGALIAHLDLNESGWAAHARVIDALLQPVVDMRHDLGDALRVMELVESCRQAAIEVPNYPFGQMPAFLLEGTR